MWRATGLAVGMMLLAGACGGGDDGPALEGVWASEIPGRSCESGLIFQRRDVDVVSGAVVCLLNSGRYGIQQALGTYARGGESLSMSWTHSSCPADRAQTDTVRFSVTADTLTISDAAGILLLNRVPAMMGGTPGGAMGTFGCFDPDFTLVPNPITELN